MHLLRFRGGRRRQSRLDYAKSFAGSKAPTSKLRLVLSKSLRIRRAYGFDPHRLYQLSSSSIRTCQFSTWAIRESVPRSAQNVENLSERPASRPSRRSRINLRPLLSASSLPHEGIGFGLAPEQRASLRTAACSHNMESCTSRAMLEQEAVQCQPRGRDPISTFGWTR